ncbi:MAG: ribbon-helix-helix domain-containing protein [Candidatus Woesearchaeota archaeon]|nr:ribbon-helix-helix domain-containing protein [Candidatus Woesearchaeota archaeon]
METVCIKVEGELLDRVNQSMKKSGYSTKTEFIREAIREKLEDDEKDVLIKEFLKFRGKGRSTTDEERRKTRETVMLEIAKEKGWEI